MQQLFEQIIEHTSKIEDPTTRAREAARLMQEVDTFAHELRTQRNNAMFEMAAAGQRPYGIGIQLGMSKSQVSALVREDHQTVRAG